MKAVALITLAAILMPAAVCAQVPEITGHTVVSMKRIDLVFSVTMNRLSIEKPGNVTIYPTGSPGDMLEIWTVYLAVDGITAYLRLVDPMVDGGSYTLALEGVVSAGGTPVPPGYEYTVTADDPTPPELHSVYFLAPDLIDLTFTEEVIESEGEDIANYTLFETANPGNVIALSGARMRGVYGRVTFELDADLVPGTQYTITAADLHDPSGNALPPGSELTFTYTGTNGRSLIGLYADGNRYNTAVSGTGIYSFDMYIFILPEEEGAHGTTFAVDYPSNVTPLAAELNPDFTITGGDLVNGVVIMFESCTHGWQWIYKQTITVMDGSPSLISILPWESVLEKNVYYLGCGEGMPAIPMGVTSHIEINAPDARPVAVEVSVYGYTMIDILFSIGLDETTAETVSNYEVFESAAPGNTVTITSATLQPDGRTVRLASSAPLSEEMQYTARMSGIESDVGIAIYPGSEITFTAIDNTRPVLLSAAMSGQHAVDLFFDEPVDDLTANSVLNYDIVLTADPMVGLDLHSAELQEDAVTVRLTVSSPMVDGTGYTAVASNVRDLCGNKMLSASTADFTADDVYPPRALIVSPEPGDIVSVFFDEILDSATAVDLNNYQMRHTTTWQLVPLTGAAWNGNEVVLYRSGNYNFGDQYNLYVMNIEDPLGNAIPSWEMTAFHYTPEVPEPLIGLWADAGRLSSAIEVYPFNMFEFYVWCKPGPNGVKCLEYAIKNTPLQNFECFISMAEYAPDCQIILGDAYTGITMCFENCKTDWFWGVRYSAFLLDGKGYIDLIPHPLAGGPQGTLCLPEYYYPIVQFDVVSRITINEYLVGTLLQSSSAEYNGTGIEISWVMREMDDGLGFIISRKRAKENAFTAIEAPAIERDGMEFRFIDSSIERGASYVYRVEYTAGGEIRTLFVTDEIATPALPLTLRQNFPNPFNPSTVIGYYLPEKCSVRLEVFDAAGRRVAELASGEQGPGGYRIEWNGTNGAGVPVGSGIYFYRLTAGKETISKKMVLLR